MAFKKGVQAVKSGMTEKLSNATEMTRHAGTQLNMLSDEGRTVGGALSEEAGQAMNAIGGIATGLTALATGILLLARAQSQNKTKDLFNQWAMYGGVGAPMDETGKTLQVILGENGKPQSSYAALSKNISTTGDAMQSFELSGSAWDAIQFIDAARQERVAIGITPTGYPPLLQVDLGRNMTREQISRLKVAIEKKYGISVAESIAQGKEGVFNFTGSIGQFLAFKEGLKKNPALDELLGDGGKLSDIVAEHVDNYRVVVRLDPSSVGTRAFKDYQNALKRHGVKLIEHPTEAGAFTVDSEFGFEGLFHTVNELKLSALPGTQKEAARADLRNQLMDYDLTDKELHPYGGPKFAYGEKQGGPGVSRAIRRTDPETGKEMFLENVIRDRYNAVIHAEGKAFKLPAEALQKMAAAGQAASSEQIAEALTKLLQNGGGGIPMPM